MSCILQAEGAAEDAGDGGEVDIKAGDAAVISTSALEEEQIKDGKLYYLGWG